MDLQSTNTDKLPIAGAIIHLEGPDGCGKTTQAKKLAEYLRDLGHDVILARQPGHTALGEKLRSVIFGDINMSLEAQRALFSADNVQFVQEVYLKKPKNTIVICDRYNPMSNMAYGAYGESMSIGYIWELNNIASQGYYPGMLIVYNVSTKTSQARLDARALDKGEILKYDLMGDEFKERIRFGYENVLDVMTPQEQNIMVYVSGEGSINKVFEDTLSALRFQYNL